MVSKTKLNNIKSTNPGYTLKPLLIRNVFILMVPVCLYSLNNSPEIRKPLKTKKRSTPDQPPIFITEKNS
jgi:hypothetical protein